jgi:hypothetical protein
VAGEVGRLATAVLGMERDLGLARQRLADIDRSLETMGDRGDLATVIASLSERMDIGMADLTRTIGALNRTVEGLARDHGPGLTGLRRPPAEADPPR